VVLRGRLTSGGLIGERLIGEKVLRGIIINIMQFVEGKKC